MKQNLLSRNMIEYTDDNLYILLTFTENLLFLKNKKSKGKLYQKSDKMPFETKLLENYLKNLNWFREQEPILKLYSSILNYFQTLTVSQFYNIILNLRNYYPPLNLNNIFEELEEIKNLPNSLKNKNNKINPITILNL